VKEVKPQEENGTVKINYISWTQLQLFYQLFLYYQFY